MNEGLNFQRDYYYAQIATAAFRPRDSARFDITIDYSFTAWGREDTGDYHYTIDKNNFICSYTFDREKKKFLPLNHYARLIENNTAFYCYTCVFSDLEEKKVLKISKTGHPKIRQILREYYKGLTK